MSSKLFSASACALAASLLALALTGCSTHPASAGFASVTINGHSDFDIAQTTVRVFQADGYAGGPPAPRMTFQREGSAMQSLAYEGVVNTHAGAATLNRVKTEIVPLGGESYRLQCQAYVVSGAGDAFFEEEKRLSNMRSAPYQMLLNKVASQLGN